MKYLLHVPFLTCLLFTGDIVYAGNLKIEIKGIEKAHGKIAVSLYNKAENFLKQSTSAVVIAAQTPSVIVTLPDIEPGEYALSVYQDLNGNSKLDTNFIGIPNEPNGVSNNVRGKYGPPKYDDAKFILGADEMSLATMLHN